MDLDSREDTPASSGDTTDSELPSHPGEAYRSHLPFQKEENGQQNGVAKTRVDSPQYALHMILEGHKAGITNVKFSANGKWIATACKWTLYHRFRIIKLNSN